MTKNSTFSTISSSKGRSAERENTFIGISVYSWVVSKGRIVHLLKLIFSRILIGRKIKLLQKLFPKKKSTCHLFQSSKKRQFGQKKQRQRRRNECFLLLCMTEMTKNSTFSIISPSTGRSAQWENNFIGLSVYSSVVSNVQILDELNFISSRILIGRQIKVLRKWF